jgi:acetyl esterase/lipase
MPDYLPGSPMQPDTTVVYATRGEQRLEMDLWLPRQAAGTVTGIRPCVLFVHGGGWHAGGRHQFHWHAGQLAARGYVTASCSYRLAPRATWPAPLDDCQQAVRFLRSHTKEFNIDTHRIAAVGSSAGGHLVACLATRDTLNDDEPSMVNVSSRVGAAVDVHGVHDFPACHHADKLREAMEAVVGAKLDEKPDLWRDISPEHFVDEKTAPIMLLHAPDDETVPYEQSVTFGTALMRAKRHVTFIPTPGSGHGYFYNPLGEWTKLVWPRVVTWIDQWAAGQFDR